VRGPESLGRATALSRHHRLGVEPGRPLPADAVEPKDDCDPETWRVIRHDEPHSSRFWRVKPACGHHHDHVVTDVDWAPESGPKTTSAERAREMSAEMEEYRASQPEPEPKCHVEQAHMRKMIELRWPLPTPEQACCTCAHARQITGYQRIGWLVAPPKPPKPAKSAKSERELLQERLAHAETEAARVCGSRSTNSADKSTFNRGDIGAGASLLRNPCGMSLARALPEKRETPGLTLKSGVFDERQV
jgi:hypothetical protein